MKKYYTLQDGILSELPNPIKVTISNPTKKLYEQFGYNPKALRIEAEPEYDIETQYLMPVYMETETEIVQTWEIKEVTENADIENSVEMEVDTAETQGN